MLRTGPRDLGAGEGGDVAVGLGPPPLWPVPHGILTKDIIVQGLWRQRGFV